MFGADSGGGCLTTVYLYYTLCVEALRGGKSRRVQDIIVEIVLSDDDYDREPPVQLIYYSFLGPE